jgi:hypothetical protein
MRLTGQSKAAAGTERRRGATTRYSAPSPPQQRGLRRRNLLRHRKPPHDQRAKINLNDPFHWQGGGEFLQFAAALPLDSSRLFSKHLLLRDGFVEYYLQRHFNSVATKTHSYRRSTLVRR